MIQDFRSLSIVHHTDNNMPMAIMWELEDDLRCVMDLWQTETLDQLNDFLKKHIDLKDETIIWVHNGEVVPFKVMLAKAIEEYQKEFDDV